MNTKYKFTGETKIELGVTLRRIEAIKDFGSVSKGEKGGWIEKETNLGVSGDAWVAGSAQVPVTLYNISSLAGVMCTI